VASPLPAEQERLLQEVRQIAGQYAVLHEEVASLARNRPDPVKRVAQRAVASAPTIHALQSGVDAMTDLLHSDEYPEEESSPESTRAAIEAIGRPSKRARFSVTGSP